ncbi:helix-turn-helix transcriptional regulator [Halomonas sp. FME1]|uniref:Helix-turn-helix transcriptional regulator n=1 Tax=Halomonas casei TaxID=2742613 RepID=A0ABR9EWH4_9GAMM|nr:MULTISPECIES: helix-turn-helix transcriptional regulator [Halomonas]MBE0398516.1 helix-turn-helix transcriptional regulator [Halomonas casei]PCC21537.1 AraC family transcriptional regulator [Halomonas sp. JB37]
MPNFKKGVSSPEDFDSDVFAQAAIALKVAPELNHSGISPHDHRKGQLILSLRGAVSCEVQNALWLVPPQHAVWIPGGTPHSCRVTQNARTCFLFVEPDAAVMPEACCTVAITPLVRELILHLAEQELTYLSEGKTARLVAVLLEQLSDAPVKELHLPISDHPKIRQIADTLFADPGDRTTLRQWAARLATSERSLARLVQSTTGLSFGRWRQQLHLMIALSHLAEGASVQSVAGTLGYDSVNAFITMFKKALGKSPTQYFSTLR